MAKHFKKTSIFSQLVLHESLQILNFDPWKVIARKRVDCYKEAQTPNISMMVFINPKTHVYTLNVLHRTYKEGQIKDMTHLDIIIQRFFDQTSPCYGFSQSSEVPFLFAQDCKVLVFGNETICDKCQDLISIKEDEEDPAKFNEEPKKEEKEESQMEHQEDASENIDLVEALLQDDPRSNKLFPEVMSSQSDDGEDIMDLVEFDQLPESDEEEKRMESEKIVETQNNYIPLSQISSHRLRKTSVSPTTFSEENDDLEEPSRQSSDDGEVMKSGEHDHSKHEEENEQLEGDPKTPESNPEDTDIAINDEAENCTNLNQRASCRPRKAPAWYGEFVDGNDEIEDQSEINAKRKIETQDNEFVPEGNRSDSEGEDIDILKRRTRRFLPRGYEIEPLSQNDSRIPCPYCTLLFKSVETFKSHLRFHSYRIRRVKPSKKASRRLKLTCSHCEAVYEQPKSLANHLKEKHNASEEEIQKAGAKNQCGICLKMCKNRNDLHVHKKKDHFIGKWQCLFCEEKPRNGKEVIEHYESNHRRSNFKIFCIICSTKLCFSDGFHVIEDHWKMCYDKRLKQQQQMSVKIQKDENSTKPAKKHMCDQCGKSFYLKYVLLEHQNEHQGIFKYQCPDCDYKSAFKSKFENHRINKHGMPGKRVYKYVPCEYCGKIVRTNAMADHIARIHSDPTVPCDLCEKLFCTRGLLNGHIKAVHSKKIPVQCKVCGMFLKSKNNLRGHMLTHEPPKFTCRFCGKGLKTSLSLGNHERIHTKENPYKCNQCSFACATGGNLLLHKKRNHGLQKTVFHTPVQIPVHEGLIP